MKIVNVEFKKGGKPYMFFDNNIELEKENITDILMKQVDEYIGYRDKYFYEWLCEIDVNETKDFINNRLIYVGKYIGVGDGNE